MPSGILNTSIEHKTRQESKYFTYRQTTQITTIHAEDTKDTRQHIRQKRVTKGNYYETLLDIIPDYI